VTKHEKRIAMPTSQHRPLEKRAPRNVLRRPDDNQCATCHKPRFWFWKRLEASEWCACPETVKAREAIGRMLT